MLSCIAEDEWENPSAKLKSMLGEAVPSLEINGRGKFGSGKSAIGKKSGAAS